MNTNLLLMLFIYVAGIGVAYAIEKHFFNAKHFTGEALLWPPYFVFGVIGYIPYKIVLWLLNTFHNPKPKPVEITKDLLNANGFELYTDPVLKNVTDDELKEMHDEGLYPDKWYEMRRSVINSAGTNRCWFIEMRWDLSNTPGRNWGCHIDNYAHSTVASADIGTVEQFNELMKLMDIEFRLS